MLSLTIGLALAAGASPVEVPAAVTWEPGSACVDEVAFGDALTRRLGEKPPEREWVAVAAHVVVEERDAGVHAKVQLRTAHGETAREMDAAGCAELTDAIALLVAMHVDPLLDPLAPTPLSEPEPEALEPAEEEPIEEPVPPPPSPEPDPSPAPLPEIEPAPSKPTPRVRPPPRGLARLDVGIGAGPLPRLGPATGVAFGVLWLPLRAEVRARYLTPQRTVADGPAALLQMWTIGPRICGEPTMGTLHFPLCAGVDGGAMHGRGRGVAQPQTQARAIVMLPASVGLAVDVTRVVSLTAEAEAGGTILRPEFAIEPSWTLWTTPAWFVRAALGVELRFP